MIIRQPVQYIAIICLLALVVAAPAQNIRKGMSSSQVKSEQSKILKRLGKSPRMLLPYKNESERSVILERVVVSSDQERVHLYFNSALGQVAMREDRIKQWEQQVRDTLGKGYDNIRVQLYSQNIPVERLVPNLYRSTIARDQKRQHLTPKVSPPLVVRLEQPVFGKGLAYRHIALWASHGYYYDSRDHRWQWQRPALFGSIEDLNTFEYTYRYLIPMLENAGAVVLSPRERAPQSTEVIIDESQAMPRSSSASWRKIEGGFGRIDTLRPHQNPFTAGHYMQASVAGNPEITYRINTTGKLALYVSYKPLATNTNKALYTVRHAAGTTIYAVNQQIGGGWLYLGEHTFDSNSTVTLNGSGESGTITADAIRLGGGMGNVLRGSRVSGLPRWAEAARYSMQYNGVPESIYAQQSIEDNRDNDYTDDYKSRGDWCNYLIQEQGVALDLALALHTNAGTNDSIFGTLTINHTNKGKDNYTNGKSKYAGRDLADIVLTQITDDLHILYTRQWTRRSLYDKGYAEISRPDVPAVIVELLSHQNFNDMKLALDPKFRFDAMRAVYKGILRFLSDRYGFAYAVQPLKPRAVAMSRNKNEFTIRWQPTVDPLEPTAVPKYYKVYTRIGNTDFDNGTKVSGTQITLPVTRDNIPRSYRITALNDGGESFSSETLSACFTDSDSETALIINGFAELSPPDTILGGFDFKLMPGIPYQHDLGMVGSQTDFDRNSAFIDNDTPGWGASSKDLATVGRPGNTFDYIIRLAGQYLTHQGKYSYISTSLEGLEDGKPSWKFSNVLLWIPERRTPLTPQSVSSLKALHAAGSTISISGKYLDACLQNTDLQSRIKVIATFER